MTLTISARQHDERTAVIGMSGQLSAMSAEQLREAVAGALEHRRSRIVLDLGGVDFIDSSGLGAVIGGLKSARQAGGDLRIVNAGAQVMMILRLTNLDQILRVYASVEAAVGDEPA